MYRKETSAKQDIKKVPIGVNLQENEEHRHTSLPIEKLARFSKKKTPNREYRDKAELRNTFSLVSWHYRQNIRNKHSVAVAIAFEVPHEVGSKRITFGETKIEQKEKSQTSAVPI